MDLDLREKIVVITGGSSGIGLETARSFAAEGAQVLIGARRSDQLARAAESIRESTSATVVTRSIDVTDPVSLDALVSFIRDRFGRVDVLVNNAGTGTYKPFLEVTDEDLEYGMAINFFAQFRLTQRVVPLMIEQSSGVVINVTGETGIRVTPPPFRSSCTGPANSAENRLSKVLVSELGELGICVNAVVPGYVNTEERFARWDDALSDARPGERPSAEANRREWGAELIVYAASDRASFVNGAVLVAGGGDDKS